MMEMAYNPSLVPIDLDESSEVPKEEEEEDDDFLWKQKVYCMLKF